MTRTELVESTQGVHLAVHELGGTGPLLVMAHATGFHGLVWKPLAERLSSKFRCVSLDFRGHGKSRLPEGADLEWRSFSQDLMAVVDHMSPDEPVRVVGHSMGGAAIAFAASAAPHRFLRAWAFEPILFPRTVGPQESPLAAAAARRRTDFASKAEALANYGSKRPLDSLHPDALRAYVDHGFDDTAHGVTISCRPEVEAGTFRHAACGADVAARAMSTPYALVIGSEDDGPADLSRAVAPMSDWLTLFETDMNHFGPLQDPDQVADMVVSWFDA